MSMTILSSWTGDWNVAKEAERALVKILLEK